jgi:palmitoyltransferase ZDHHC9/14/18
MTIWSGSNRFFFAGRFQAGPQQDCGYNICLWSTILLPMIFFFILPAPTIWVEISPSLVLVTAGLMLISMVLFILTTFSDPGYIPPKEVQVLLGIQNKIRSLFGINSINPLSAEKAYLCPTTNNLIIENEIDERLFLTEELLAQGYKYCATCRIIRPPRASHCADCNKCCLRHDHHCPFVNNCVGQRNYVLFCSFIVSTVVLGLMVLFSVILWIGNGTSQLNGDSLIVRIIGYAVGIPTGLSLLAAFFLVGYHGFLACSGKTTREHLRGDSRRPDLTRTTVSDSAVLSSSFFARPPRLYPSMRLLVRIPVKESSSVSV